VHKITGLLYINTLYMSDLELTFSTTLVCPLTNQTVDVPIKEGGLITHVTVGDKVSLVSPWWVWSGVWSGEPIVVGGGQW